MRRDRGQHMIARDEQTLLGVEQAEMISGVAGCMHRDPLAPGEAHVHVGQYREHEQSQERWPLHQEPQHDQHKAAILWMAHVRIRSRYRQSMTMLRGIQHLPGGRQQPEATADQRKAQQVKRPEVRIGTPPEQHLQQMSRIVGQPVHLWIVGL